MQLNRNRITDHCELFLLFLVEGYIELGYFDGDFTALVCPKPYFRMCATGKFGVSLVAGDLHRVGEDTVPPTDSGQVTDTRGSVPFIQSIRP